MIKKLILYVSVWKVSLLSSVLLLHQVLQQNTEYFPRAFFRVNIPYIVWVWGNFDGYFYVSIARNGYQQFQEPFFPFYSLCIKLLRNVSGFPYIVNGILISNLCLFGALYFCYKLLILEKKQKSIYLFFLIVLSFPTSFYFNAVYNDALFFFLATATLYCTRTHRWVFASILASFATLTRLNGLALIFPILIEFFFYHFHTTKIQWKLESFYQMTKSILRTGIYTVVLIPASFIGFLVYIHIVRGNWMYVFTTMSIWNQDKITFPLQVFWRYFKILVLYPSSNLPYFIAFVELSFVLLYIFLMIYAYKKMRLSYWVFFVVSIIIPSLTGTFQGMPRYGLHLFPFFLSLLLFVENKIGSNKKIYFIISIIFLVIFLSLFAHGYFVA